MITATIDSPRISQALQLCGTAGSAWVNQLFNDEFNERSMIKVTSMKLMMIKSGKVNT